MMRLTAFILFAICTTAFDGEAQNGPPGGGVVEPQILKYVNPIYPEAALDAELSGRCDVLYDVTEEGEPHNLQSFCSDLVFCKSASDAVVATPHSPALRQNRKIPFYKLIYPFDFLYEGNRPLGFGTEELINCTERDQISLDSSIE